MQANQPQGFKSYELANVPQSGIGEAAQNRFQVVQKAVYNGFAGLAPMLPKPETYVQPAAQTQPVHESVPVYTAVNYPQDTAATSTAEEATILTEEGARNNLDAIYREINEERRAA